MAHPRIFFIPQASLILFFCNHKKFTNFAESPHIKMNISLIMLIPLLPMIISDYRDRTVHVLWLAVFGAAAVLSACFCMGWKILIFNILLNSSVLLLMALFLALYFKLRKKKLSGMIGEGDCVFLFLLAPYFQLHNYLMFLVVSSCAALVSWHKSFDWNKNVAQKFRFFKRTIRKNARKRNNIGQIWKAY